MLPEQEINVFDCIKYSIYLNTLGMIILPVSVC